MSDTISGFFFSYFFLGRKREKVVINSDPFLQARNYKWEAIPPSLIRRKEKFSHPHPHLVGGICEERGGGGERERETFPHKIFLPLEDRPTHAKKERGNP